MCLQRSADGFVSTELKKGWISVPHQKAWREKCSSEGESAGESAAVLFEKGPVCLLWTSGADLLLLASRIQDFLFEISAFFFCFVTFITNIYSDMQFRIYFKGRATRRVRIRKSWFKGNYEFFVSLWFR